MSPNPPVTVLYILCIGRSGSTLLERMIGAIPGFVTVGESVDIFPRGIGADERCGCGSWFSACPFWLDVGRRAFGGWNEELARRFGDAERHCARHRHLPVLASPARSLSFESHLATYLDCFAALYDGVARASRADVIVDASKQSPHALALARDGRVDLRLVHLVRDVRGVAYSWSKSGVALLQARGQRTFPRLRTGHTALRWLAKNAEASAVRHFMDYSVVVRYEDLVQDPRATITAILRALNLPSSSLDHLKNHSVVLPSSHGFSGNPQRYHKGKISLRADDEWQTGLRQPNKLLIELLAGQGLRHYGYPLRST